MKNILGRLFVDPDLIYFVEANPFVSDEDNLITLGIYNPHEDVVEGLQVKPTPDYYSRSPHRTDTCLKKMFSSITGTDVATLRDLDGWIQFPLDTSNTVHQYIRKSAIHAITLEPVDVDPSQAHIIRVVFTCGDVRSYSYSSVSNIEKVDGKKLKSARKVFNTITNRTK